MMALIDPSAIAGHSAQAIVQDNAHLLAWYSATDMHVVILQITSACYATDTQINLRRLANVETALLEPVLAE
jgi:hypothetical protein